MLGSMHTHTHTHIHKHRFANWSLRTSPFAHDPSIIYGNIYVPTMETERLSYLIDLLMRNRYSAA